MLGLIVLFPLLGFLVNGVWYAAWQTRKGVKPAGAMPTGILASAAVVASFAASVAVFWSLHSAPEGARIIEQTLFRWITLGDFDLAFGLRADPLTSVFLLVITGVGALIHVYSIGYMSHDETPGKFFAYLNLFCFAMLVLVLGASFPVMFLGWEGVGLCSYLLIGYWYGDMEKAKAGKKAFVVNRIGDLGFLLGIFLIYTTFGTLDFEELRTIVLQDSTGGGVAGISELTITAICLFLFLGCTGKSAQIPLYVWLPDAMAGPTPVSALIHAATMVTSGIYLVARMNFLYSLAPVAMEVVAWIGALTALLAATIAIVQTDIKKVLAYSTVSQLGYMFLACGVGAYSAGVFHVVTHAFFKALLFLGAGSVIFGLHHEQDILKMGGLRKHMGKTYATFALAWLAICGIPPFSGFFSKDEILWKAFSGGHGSPALWAIGALTALMTAFYMTRLFSLTFLGTSRQGGHEAHGHDDSHGHEAHESPGVMTYPLMILAVLSVVGGLIGIPHASWIEHWLSPVIPEEGHATSVAPAMEWVLMAVSVVLAALGIFAGLKMYRDLSFAERLKQRWEGLHRVLREKWFVDELYEAVVVRPILALSGFAWKGIDVGVIDRTVVGVGRVTQWAGQTLRVIQTGSIQVYAVTVLVGILVTLGYLIYGMA